MQTDWNILSNCGKRFLWLINILEENSYYKINQNTVNNEIAHLKQQISELQLHFGDHNKYAIFGWISITQAQHLPYFYFGSDTISYDVLDIQKYRNLEI